MELWDLYTADREKTGKTMVRGEKQPSGFYRIVVHICIFNDMGEMLIQQRQPFKSGWSNMWDVSVGGSAVSGDNSRRAAERELCEELGLELSFDGIDPALTVNVDGCFDDIYIITKNVDLSELSLQYEEVQAVKWADIDEILSMIDAGVFIPYDKSLIELLFFMSEHRGVRTRKDGER
ncbi:MAG: NUDIX domain-containing protein [Clostridia bacterium]|nr:NUDIX domain-containing protein [Clostridia bacterium]